ncbi:zinc-binding dehydrogenase [Polyangium jinanense]|uniref:alcohol dehydrogenase n=1 Tax=Polyangium jinanense TaxID=2829994 RepID=A0A9X3X2A9_9BACT|nr:zinc-binding dehydrogenase [Polyangium jinanense]MDC3952513.1 zinc-binding dehydrogenase [Polyangium jinanense]MDC3980141.1 zinc-binding dehydrogenase [Polyangium jinanense]
MRAVVLRETGGPDKLVPSPNTPDPVPAADEVLVRVRASAVCGRDLIDRRGGFPLMKLPTILGHEFAGEVESVGEEAARAGVAPGDRVANLHRPSCGECPRCVGGEELLCERAYQSFGHTVDGGYAELVVAHHRALVKVPASVPFEDASTLMCTAGVAYQALAARARLAAGETVVITGASGGVGTAAIQVARHLGARVVAVTGSPSKAAALADLGAHEVVVSPDGKFEDDVKARLGGPVDVALELTGSATFSSALKSLRRGGRMVVVGNIDQAKVSIKLGALILWSHTIAGSASCTRQDLEHVLGLAASGALRVVIDRKLPLRYAAEAHSLLEARAVFGRVVLIP